MKKIQMLLFALLLLLAVSTSAMAALPAEVTTAFTGLSTLITDLVAAVWPILASVLLAFGTISLVKKFWGKVA